MRVCHFEVEHLDGASLGADIGNGGNVPGLRNAYFRRFAVALEQQLPTLLEQDRVAPAVGGLERVAFGGGEGLPVV